MNAVSNLVGIVGKTVPLIVFHVTIAEKQDVFQKFVGKLISTQFKQSTFLIGTIHYTSWPSQQHPELVNVI